MTTHDVPPAVLAAWNLSPAAEVSPLEGGLINRTWLVRDGNVRQVLQRLHPVFKATVHLDIDAITRHLESRGMITPRLLPTAAGTLWLDGPDGAPWRMMTFVDGRVVHKVTSPALAHAAGVLVARFHRAVSDLEHTFHFSRPGAHDTALHMRRLEEALATHAAHPRRAEVEPVARAILQDAAGLPVLPREPIRIVHGDLKISNLLFDDALEHGVALLDLDTMAHMTIPLEMGDALRSWCNPAGEDHAHAEADPAIFAGAIEGYASLARGFLVPAEVGALVAGVQTIALELAARFCADALNESYFGWDSKRYATRGEHNLVRARSQLGVSRSVLARRPELERVVASAFGTG